MFILAMHDPDFEFLCDDIMKCPDCYSEFENIVNIRKPYTKHNFKCNVFERKGNL